MASVKWKLDDLVLQVINPDIYKEIDKKLKSSNKERDKYIKTVTSALNDELLENKLSPSVYGRSKSHSSIYGKMVLREKSFEEIHDILAIRVVVKKLKSAIWHWESFIKNSNLFKKDLKILLLCQKAMDTNLSIQQ